MSIMNFEGSQDALAELLVDERARGKSIQYISDRHGIPKEEVYSIIKDYYSSEVIRDPVEHRALMQIRINKLADKLWDLVDVDAGQIAPKAADSIMNGIKILQELFALNEQTLNVHMNVILDEDATKVFEVLKYANSELHARVMTLPLNKKAQEQLAAWPEWTAEASTNAVEKVIYAEEEEGE